MWNFILILGIGAGFYFYVQLIFASVADPLYASMALLIGCLFAAGFSRELLIMAPEESQDSQREQSDDWKCPQTSSSR